MPTASAHAITDDDLDDARVIAIVEHDARPWLRCYELDDLQQVAYEAVLLAARTYRADRGPWPQWRRFKVRRHLNDYGRSQTHARCNGGAGRGWRVEPLPSDASLTMRATDDPEAEAVHAATVAWMQDRIGQLDLGPTGEFVMAGLLAGRTHMAIAADLGLHDSRVSQIRSRVVYLLGRDL